MTYVKKTIRQRFPKSTFALAVIVILLIIVMVDMVFLNWWIATTFYTVIILGTFNFFAEAPLQVAATAGIIVAVVLYIKYRQRYGKKEVLMQSQPTAPLQGGLINSNPIPTQQNTGTIIVEDEE